MFVAHKTKRAIHRLAGFWPLRRVPMGTSLFADLDRLRPLEDAPVFDVGANVGQSVPFLLSRFRKSQIHSFEPVSGTFAKLKQKFGATPRVTLHQIACSDTIGEAEISLAGTPDMFHLADKGEEGPSETVKLVTIDAFAAEHGIKRIAYLKIDTEGADLKVLAGAREMLEASTVGLVEVESGMSPDNDYHVPFEQMKSYLEQFGYRIFGIYEQVPEWPTNRPMLRRTNAVYISPDLIKARTGG